MMAAARTDPVLRIPGNHEIREGGDASLEELRMEVASLQPDGMSGNAGYAAAAKSKSDAYGANN